MDFATLAGVLTFAVVTCIGLSAAPLVLKKAGFFDLLGKSKVGLWLSEKLGSKEPSVFAMNAVRVFFFSLIAFYLVTGIATDATQFEIHKPAIEQMEVCKNNFVATQYAFGQWAIKCNDIAGSLNLSDYNLTSPSS